MRADLYINHMGKDYQVSVIEITWQTDRKGVPGILNFSVIKTKKLKFSEGDAVRLIVKNKGLFFGFIFTKKRNKDGIIQVTAYDQLRYLKNKDSFSYTNKTASELISILAKKFRLRTGNLENTKYKIASIISDNETLFDKIQSALDDTLMNRGQIYVLYDDFGKLTLKNISKMKTEILIDEESALDFDYTSTIDTNTYNKIQLVNNDDKKSKRTIIEVQHGANINKWGVLQYTDKFKDGENAKAKAEALLNYYNHKTRSLSIKDAFGSVKIRAGKMVVVQLNLGDIKTSRYMIVEKCKHTFKEDEHTMDLTLIGGDFIA